MGCAIKMNEAIEIMGYCYSKKANVSIGFGAILDYDITSVGLLDTEWIDFGIPESFWENYHEFEAGIEKARLLVKDNDDLTFEHTLYDILGDFDITYEINGKEIVLDFSFDVNEVMYELLKT